MASKLAADLRHGDLIWLRCSNGRTGARVESVERAELGHVTIYAGPDCARAPVIVVDVKLGRGAQAEIGGPVLFRWQLWFEAGERLELVEKVRGAR